MNDWFFSVTPGQLALLLGLGALVVAAAGVGVAVYGWYTRRTMRRLEQMLEQAIAGSFEQGDYSEARLSRLEEKLSRFLNSSQLSRRAIEEDRGRIKSLIGDISHQTKTPLANILLYGQLLDEQPLPEAARPMLAQINTEAEKLRFLIEALVKLSRLESGVVQPVAEVQSLEPLLQALEQSFRPVAEQKGVSLRVLSTGARACFDCKWTQEAVGNLVDNAIKYTPAGGHVSVACEQYAMFCRITVRDDGPGIPESEQAAVFRRFYRGSAAAKSPGVGVGLALARQIATLQGGYIKLASEPGKGSEFSLYLPLEAQM